jgi:3-oxoadipate enol-lactonase
MTGYMEKENKIKKSRRSINGGVISYYENNAHGKPCLLFLHAFPFNKEIWKDQLAYFANDFYVLAPDFRGFGNSSKGYKHPSIDLFTDDIKILLESLGIEKANICGLSLGGYVTLQFVKKYPQLVQSLILCDTQCREDTKLEMTERYKTVDDIIAYGLHYFSEVLLPRLVSENSFLYNQGLMRTLRAMIYSGRRDAIVFTIMALARRDDTCDILKGIEKPSLIMVGQHDKVTPVSEAIYLHQNIKGSVLKIIPDAGHLSNIDSPSVFNESLAVYLDYIGAKKRKVA